MTEVPSERGDDASNCSRLLQLLQETRVPADLHSNFLMYTAEEFGCVATNLEDLNTFIDGLCLPADQAQPLTVARIRLLWQRCQALIHSTPASSAQAPSAGTTTEAAASWNEVFPAKIPQPQVVALRQAFEKAYPSEVLDSDNMPSARLLALIQKNVTSGAWTWVPWKHRMSQAQADNINSSRPAKIPRLETLIYDEPPHREVPSGATGSGYILSVLSLHSTALALLQGAHLGVCRLYDRQFAKFACARHSSDSGRYACLLAFV